MGLVAQRRLVSVRVGLRARARVGVRARVRVRGRVGARARDVVEAANVCMLPAMR